jgi:hypothetical protein
LELRMIMGKCGREAIVALMPVAGSGTAIGAEEANKPCVEDAMIVFDASGSMAGSLAEGIGATIRRIDEVRKALAQVLPSAARCAASASSRMGLAPKRNAMATSSCGLNPTPPRPSWKSSSR